MERVRVSRTDLARRTREIVDKVRRGQVTFVESYGEEQAVLLDAVDYRILRALADYATAGREGDAGGENAQEIRRVIGAYLRGEINLGKAAELLKLSRFELMERFDRLGVPLRIGPATVEDARDEVKAARKGRRTSS